MADENQVDEFKRTLFLENLKVNARHITANEIAMYINGQCNKTVNDEVFKLMASNYCEVPQKVKSEIMSALRTGTARSKLTISVL